MAALDVNPPSDRTDMSLSVFHPFTRLPTEMRWKIWTAACLKSTPTSCGLQYIDVKYGWAEPIPSPNNRSAYLIDHGLWKACKESRQVICQHSEFRGWLEVQKRAIDEDKCFKDCGPPGESRFHPDILGVKEYPHPAIIDLCGCGEDCRMLVRPGRDIFCLKIENWERSSSPNITMSFLYRYFTTETTHKRRQNIPVKKFALEFDKSWMTNLPSSMYSMSEEASARGYLANLLEKIDWGNTGRRDLWIIDKEVKWSRAVGENARVYRDYDAEYIEAHWSNVVNYKGYGAPPTASQFMKDLEDIDGRLVWNAGGLKPKSIIGLLVRRDNEVNDPRLGSAWRDGFGWVIEKDDNWDWQLDSDDDRDWQLDSDDDLGMIDDSDRDGDEDEDENLGSDENSNSDEGAPGEQ